ncbi:MAG TPA: LytR C-terminal domain-containing protein [Dermatophilaceae bacterium]|nr:LytR C-terminal domain-containing protein [Dermatophilaceae bacterium]
MTLLVVALALFLAFWYAFSYYRASNEERAAEAARPTCLPYDPKALVPAKVTVNVYNSTDRTGLAASTAKALERQGFVVDAIANDPLDRTVTAPAEVRHGPPGAKQAALVARTVGKGVTVRRDGRKDASVDLVVGTAFRALVPLPTPAMPTCSPTPTASS